LKNWALSRCLGEVYHNDAVKKDAQATAGGFLEFGQQPIEAYEPLQAVASRYANRTYGSAIGSDLNTMKCIDLFHSQELDRIVNRILNKYPPGKRASER
jgi:hypothetical protein